MIDCTISFQNCFKGVFNILLIFVNPFLDKKYNSYYVSIFKSTHTMSLRDIEIDLYLAIILSFYLHIYLSGCLSIYLFVCLYNCISIYLCIYLFIYIFIHQHIYLLGCLSINISFYASTYLCISIYLLSEV